MGAAVTVTTGDAASGAVVQLGAPAPATVNCSAALTLSDSVHTSRPSTVSFGVSSSACEPARLPRTWFRPRQNHLHPPRPAAASGAALRPLAGRPAAHACPHAPNTRQVSRVPTVTSVPSMYPQWVSVLAPAAVTLSVPAGYASYAWSTDGDCGPRVNFSAAVGATSRTLTLTTGPTGASVFNAAGEGLGCGFRLAVTNVYGLPAVAAPFNVEVRLRSSQAQGRRPAQRPNAHDCTPNLEAANEKVIRRHPFLCLAQVMRPPITTPVVVPLTSTNVVAPDNVTLTVPLGYERYTWMLSNECYAPEMRTRVKLNELTTGYCMNSPQITLTSGPTSDTVFNLGGAAADPITCGARVLVMDAYGGFTVSDYVTVTVRGTHHMGGMPPACGACTVRGSLAPLRSRPARRAWRRCATYLCCKRVLQPSESC